MGLCDLDEARRERWAARVPRRARARPISTSCLRIDADVVDVLVPTPAHGPVVTRVLDAGFHVQVQKPIARSLEDADAMLAAAAAHRARTLRVLEDYLVLSARSCSCTTSCARASSARRRACT